MTISLYLTALASLATVVLSYTAGIRRADNDGISLAISPVCGKLNLTATSVTNVNAGLLPLSSYKTIVTFGDSYTAGGVRDGSTLASPVVIPPNPKAGGRTTNGRVWIEDISVDTGALFKDYAVRAFGQYCCRPFLICAGWRSCNKCVSMAQ